MKTASFYELFCLHNRCQPADFSEAVLRRCFCRGRYFPARLLALIHSGYFTTDFALIEAVKPLASANAVKAELIAFQDMHPDEGLLRGLLKLRISRKRLLNEAEWLFGRASSTISVTTAAHKGDAGPI
jgi:hypothetical protein